MNLNTKHTAHTAHTHVVPSLDEEDEWWDLVDRDSRQDESAGEASIEMREQGK